MTNILDEFDKRFDNEGIKEDIKEAHEKGGNVERKEVPFGKYEVTVEKCELVATKQTNKPMVTIWFKIDNGNCKGQYIFYNQIIAEGFQLHINNNFIKSMDTGLTIEFDSFKQYGQLMLDVFETCQSQKLAFVLDYGKNAKGYNTFKILDVFEG